jgi:SAM-dependent methyltransferase
MSLLERWDAQADAWARFARTPGLDHWHERFNLPRFLELLPPHGRATLDLGCGEGRVGAALLRLGHRVVGVDGSARMVELARERHDAVVADAAALPFDDETFDLVVAYMSLQDIDDLDGAVREAARVLDRGGRLCFAIVHPINSAGQFESKEPDSPFAIEGSYLRSAALTDVVERDGLRVEFAQEHRPLEAYVRALEQTGLLIDALREPVPAPAHVADRPGLARWQRVPGLLHVSAVKP